MNNRNFFYDILRDKGSLKFSITKTLAFGFSIFLITYLVYELFFNNQLVDHGLVAELLGTILTLVGLKNNWGVTNDSKKVNNTTELPEPTVVDSKGNDEEGEF